MQRPFPQQDAALRDQQVLDDIEWVKTFIVGIRNIRGEMDISPNKPLSVLLKNVGEQDRRRLAISDAFLSKLARLEQIDVLPVGDNGPASARPWWVKWKS